MANELVLIETKIKEADAALMTADKHSHKVVEMKIAAGLLYAEARDMCWKQGLDWSTECKRVTSRSYSQIKKMLQIAKAPDPYAEEKRQREAAATSMRETREERHGSNVGATLQTVGVEPELWTAAKPVPAGPLPVGERALVKGLKAGLTDCSPEEREEVNAYQRAQGWIK